CLQLKDCPKAPVPLAVPALPSCFPAPVNSMTWTLHPPPHGTVELWSTNGTLRQAVRPCNNSIVLNVVEDDGISLGKFCPQGAIEKLQIHTNVSVTAFRMGDNVSWPSSQSLLTASFSKMISESYIFTVSPKKGVPVLLATPGWPEGMKSYSTVSWIVFVPPKMKALLMFTKLNQPKCSNRHTNIKVQSLGSLEEMYSRREDEPAELKITAHESFYLNMSNCMPETGSFSVVTQITLHNDKDMLLPIILSVVAALLVITVVVLAVVCVVIRKKKQKLNHQVSIYNPNPNGYNGASLRGFPKSREDNESHIYSTIEDTLVYTHLLRRGEEMGVYGEVGEVDTYQAFTGPTDQHKPPLSMGSATENLDVGVYQPFVPVSQQGPPVPNRPPSKAMVDNELYGSEVLGQEVLGPRMEPEGGN
ncbi:CUB domain-containing protein 1-like, partial [Diretmus argenteus]